MANQNKPTLTIFPTTRSLEELVSKQELNLAFKKRCIFIQEDIEQKKEIISDPTNITRAGKQKQEEEIIQLQNELSDIHYFLNKWGE
ncbi:hypothetical protein [Wohlfahrtiimonas larvae]|uniref:Uncharacterized protein n=1 Tax=Wohlfahrtiimonas larvae TaxID=1157986 RepID=A0ABP9MSP8_9GAMM|nr:hypothetical protein [Wohlfahrtiimonas larvae]